MAVTDVARFIILVQFIILGLYRVVSEETMLVSSLIHSNVIRICNTNRWQQYQVSPGGNILYLTADLKRRILYWTTKTAYYSLALDGKKTVVNLSQKFEEGLVYQDETPSSLAQTELLQRYMTSGNQEIMDIRVHDGQIIFAAYNWGLMKFDVETNRKLFSLKKDSDVTKYAPTLSTMNMDVCGNDTCLYWHGPDEGQLSRYLINSNINQILVQRFSKEWTPWAVYQKKIYWSARTIFFTTDMNKENKVTFYSDRLNTNIICFIREGIMYYLYDSEIPKQFLKKIYPMKSYSSACPISYVEAVIGIPASHPSTDNHQNVDDDHGVVKDGDDDDQDVEDVVKTDVWSTVGYSLGIVFTLIILVIICFRLVKMVRSQVRETNPNPREDVYALPARNVSDDHIYKDLKIQAGSEPRYTEVIEPTYIDITESKNIEVIESHNAEIT